MHDHSHQHHPSSSHRALVWALALSGAFLLIEASVGVMTGSLALLSDAVHMLSDVGALALALVAAKLAAQAADAARTFGLRRAEVLEDPAVTSAHDVHVWSLDGQTDIVSAHVRMLEPEHGERTRRALVERLQQRLNIHHLTLQIEGPELHCALSDCGFSGGLHA